MEVIHVYTRKQALEDGVLVDVSTLAKEAGLRYPTAVTAAVWAEYVAVPEDLSDQDETGRLWDIVWMLALRIRRERPEGTTLLFQLYVRNCEEQADIITLKSICGPGDDGEPVLTIMLPHED